MTDASGGDRRPPHRDDVLDDEPRRDRGPIEDDHALDDHVDDVPSTTSTRAALPSPPDSGPESSETAEVGSPRGSDREPTGGADADSDDDFAPPPERPALSDDRRAPVLKQVPPPRPVRIARVLWLTSFFLTSVAMLLAFLLAETIVAELEEALLRNAPGYDEASIDSLASAIYWSSVGGSALVVVLEAVLLAMLLNRRGGARWVQIPVLVLHAGTALVGTGFLTLTEWGPAIQVALLGGFVLALVAWPFGLAPSVHRWCRTRGEVQPASLH